MRPTPPLPPPLHTRTHPYARSLLQPVPRACRVYACTLPGFGPSEKSPQNYTTDLWKAYVRDFMVHVVGRPGIVAGNSIGGVIPANACADHPHVFEGIVLVNTAGSTESLWDPENIPDKKPQQQIVVNVLGWTTFKYLQRGIRKQVPTPPPSPSPPPSPRFSPQALPQHRICRCCYTAACAT